VNKEKEVGNKANVKPQEHVRVVTKIVKPDAFLCEFDTARWAYLLSRTMEYAYRKVQRLHKRKNLDPEIMMESEALLREMSKIFNEADEKINKIAEKINSL